ncbi:MAG TPA: hypothetical protein VGR90_06835, partial [Acidimicrobiales bacterium]|nr:hypothetical protein [Acidimicrobiales bacterium]
LDGNLVTGTLNLAEGPGSYWWFSAAAGWRLLDEGIGNANGPVVLGGMQHGWSSRIPAPTGSSSMTTTA